MSDRSCRHPILSGYDVPGPCLHLTRCRTHDLSTVGAAVWTWSRSAMAPRPCPCDKADRFVVATERASRYWLQSADVVLGSAQSTVSAPRHFADRLRGLPGCTLIVIPAGPRGTLFRTRTEQIMVTGPGMCGVCLYPWLVTGHRLKELGTAS